MTEKTLAVIVLAAGQGTRMKSRTPKVLHPLGGRPLVSHVLLTAQSLGADYLGVVVRHERDQVSALIAENFPTAIIIDQDEIPGTGRAVQQGVAALPADFSGDILVLSGDVPLLETSTLRSLIEGHRGRGSAATLLSAVVEHPTGYGRVVRNGSGDVQKIVEQKDASSVELAIAEINAGVYVFQAAALREALDQVGTDNAQGEMYLTDVIGLFCAESKPVAAEIAEDASATFGINDRIQLAEAARVLNNRIIRYWQREGVTIIDPATTWIDPDVSLAMDVTVHPNTHLMHATSVGEGASIGPDTSLKDCEVGENAQIRRTDATLAVIGAGALVGPFAYLRPGTVLGDGGKIGTFVETKNSQIGAGSKVPHLSYIGDAILGTGVNLGAGAITANYDDIAKHQTRIDDDVHTGSHNVFVAPVRLGAGAKTGAGAVIRKDVPAGALALSVAPQRNIDGWVEKNRSGTAAAQAAEQARKSAE